MTRPAVPTRVPATGRPKIDTSIIVPVINWESEKDTGGVSGGVSAAFHQGELLVVYKGSKSSKLYENIYGIRAGQAKWLGEARIANQSSQDYPAITAAGDQVVMVHTSGGEGSDHRMWLSVRTGEHWDNDTSMGQFYRSNRGPALASDGDFVYIAYKDSESDKIIYDYCTVPANGQHRRLGFSNIYNLRLEGRSSETATMTAVGRKVYLAYCGSSDSIWYTLADAGESNFEPQLMVPGIGGKAPCLVNDGEKVFLFFLSPDRRQLVYATYNGRRWNEFRYHRLARAAHDIAVAVQPKHPDCFHLVYTAEADKRIYHSIGRTR